MPIIRTRSHDDRSSILSYNGFFAFCFCLIERGRGILRRIQMGDMDQSWDTGIAGSRRYPSSAVYMYIPEGEVLGFIIAPNKVVDNRGMTDAFQRLFI